MRRLWLPFVGSALLTALVTAACGASDLVAPAPDKPSDVAQCRGFDQLMPNFVAAIDTGRTENLKVVVEQELLKPLREGDAPPVNDVLRAIFATLSGFAAEPPEVGAPPGQYCVPVVSPDAGVPQQPPLDQANELCEMKRSLYTLIHDARGVDALGVVEPQLRDVLNYIIGKSTDQTEHYDVAYVLSSMAGQTAQCQMSNGLDLVIGFTEYLQTPDGKDLALHLSQLTQKPSVQGLFDPSHLDENGFVAIIEVLLPILQTATPADLDNAMDSLPIPSDVRQDLNPLIGDLKKLMVRPEVMGPTRKALVCLAASDPCVSSDANTCKVGRMLYRLALRDQLPEFGLTRLSQVMQELQDVDQRGSLLYVADVLAKAVRRDDQAVDSAALVVHTLLSRDVPTGQVRSNAQLVLPVAADLVEHGIISEAICALDTLLFGCTGGSQPACPAS